MNLKAILKQHNIKQSRLRAGVLKPDGGTYSKAVISLIVNRGEFPKSADTDDIKLQITTTLACLGVTDKIDWHKTIAPKVREQTPQELPQMEMLSEQAKQIFGLTKTPFVDDIKSRDDVYLSNEQRYIRQTMLSTAKHGGLMAIVGESGAGKTTLKRHLISELFNEQEKVIVIQPRTVDKVGLRADHLCDAIIYDLSQGVETPKRSKEAKMRQVEKLLINSHQVGYKHCLIIEEAQDLTVPTLKHLKRFLELEDMGMNRLLSIVLLAQPEFTHKMNASNAQLREVFNRCEIVTLQPLNANVGEYLKHKLARIGKRFDEIFAADAMDGLTARLSRTTGRGTVSYVYPLIVNNTVISAMNESAKLGQDVITADIFEGV